MDWNRDLPSWPNREYSSRIKSRPCDWHVQQDGAGETLLLLHGAGGSVHSWRDCLPRLSERYHVVAIDLPGHGFTKTTAPHRSGLLAMAEDVLDLCDHEGWSPGGIVAHSAGAALALQIARLRPVQRILAFNPALAPFRGLASVLFPAAARVLSTTPFMVDGVLRHMATPDRVETLLAGTGSKIDPTGRSCYARLFRDSDHLNGTVSMMANWKLDPLLEDIGRIEANCLFLCGGRDKTVPPDIALSAARHMQLARVEVLENYGHLLHEEAPAPACRWIMDWFAQVPTTATA